MSIASALKNIRPFLAVLVALGLAAGFAAKLAGLDAWSPAIWAAVTLPVLLALLAEIVTSLRRGDLGLDIVAALSMTAALAVGENLAAAIVALMYAGGQYLEAFAERAARREMTALLSRVPRTAMRHRDGQLEEVALDLILPGDRLLVRRGDVVPVDGIGRRRGGGARPVGADRRIAAGAAPQRRFGLERLDQCRRRLRSGGVAAGGGKHLCRRHPPGGGGAALARPHVAAGGPLRDHIPGGDRGAGCCCLGAYR